MFVAMTGRGPRHHRRHWGGSGFGAPGPRARRGDVRAAILALLAEEPRNGYQLIQEINERTQGVWRPSPGAVYPALALLEDEGLVKADEADGKRTFALTDAGRKHVSDHAEEIGKPWEKVTEGLPEGELALRDHIRQLVDAVVQVVRAGDASQVEQAKQVMADARKSIYRILANGE
jgi:DNA-binding PadR family transcriptional regulator